LLFKYKAGPLVTSLAGFESAGPVVTSLAGFALTPEVMLVAMVANYLPARKPQ
jgi:hypothetical protein